MFRTNYGTGAGNVDEIETLEKAMELADEDASYTQTDIEILDENNKLVAIRRWYGVEFNPDDYENGEDADVISYGKFGFYDEWQTL